MTRNMQVPAYWTAIFGFQDWVYRDVFAELKKTIAMSAIDIVMPRPMESWDMSICIIGEGVAVAFAIVDEVISMPDISMVQASGVWM